MTKVDMSAQAVTSRLKRTSQLRRLGLSLGKATLKQERQFGTTRSFFANASEAWVAKNKKVNESLCSTV